MDRLARSEIVFQLGLQYDEGNGVQENKAEALRLYREADAMGNVHATVNLGMLYLEGKVVERNAATAFQFFNPRFRLLLRRKLFPPSL